MLTSKLNFAILYKTERLSSCILIYRFNTRAAVRPAARAIERFSRSLTTIQRGTNTMNRREALGIVGTACGGILAGNSPATAGEHGDGARESAPPIDNIHLFFCGFHVAKHNTKIQFETHHFCSPRGDKMHQCLLYDSSDKHARLIGVEYIIADELFQDLPDAEKKFWHPHTYEVMSGGLIAPHMTRDGEDDFMKALINTWGKTWHTWPDPKTPVPMGEPLLMWSLTGDGQENRELAVDRDRRFKVSTKQIREHRTKSYNLPVPQIPPPASVEVIGRRWTADGPDTPEEAFKRAK